MQKRSQRLAEFDVVSRWEQVAPPLVIQFALGATCIASFILIRIVVDFVAPSAGPFAPIYPLVLIATLFGRWRAGLVTYLGCFAWSWLVVLPRAAARNVPLATDTSRTFVSALTVLVVLVFAEIFRQAVRRAVAGREEAIAALRERERELQRLNHDLGAQVAERTREASRMFQLSPDLQGTLNGQGFFEASNPAWHATLGLSAEQVRTTSFLDLIHPDDLDRTQAAWTDLLNGRTTQPFENRFRTSDGRWRWLSWVVVPEGGRFYCSARDVTDQKVSEAALLELQETLRQSQKLEAIGQLTGGVAHDFNNLLTVIRGSVELLRRPALTSDKRDRYIDAIGETAERAAKLTGQLLAFARRQALKPETFDCAASLLEVAGIVRTLAGSRIEVTTAVPDQPCFISADRSQFDTAIINMGVNARDAMDGEGRLIIAVGPVSGIPALRAHPPVPGDYVAITIGDTGTGIAPEDLARVFEPFFTTKEQGKGTGLGLSQVIGFAKQSGGDIRVDSVASEGTIFTLYLPQVTADVDAKPENAFDGTQVSGEGICVLVVEDNTQVGEFATQALKELGFDSVLARDAEEALRQLGAPSANFNVVFSDVVMPGRSGLELAAEIRRLHPDLPVILTSGYSHVLSQNGSHGYELLHKPYSIEQLSRVFQKALTWHRTGSSAGAPGHELIG